MSIHFFWGEILTYTYDENGRLKCSNCGSFTFDLIAEMRITDVSADDGDPIGNRTIESETVVGLVCARCGARVND